MASPLATRYILICAPDVFARAFDPDGRLRLKDRLRMQRDMPGGISAIRVSPGLVGWKTNTGPVPIVPSRLPDSPELWSAHTVEGTGVRLASVSAILQGKLKGRLLAKGFAEVDGNRTHQPGSPAHWF